MCSAHSYLSVKCANRSPIKQQASPSTYLCRVEILCSDATGSTACSVRSRVKASYFRRKDASWSRGVNLSI